MVPSDPVMIERLRRHRMFALALVACGLLLVAIKSARLISGFDWINFTSACLVTVLVVLSGLRAIHVTAVINSADRQARPEQ